MGQSALPGGEPRANVIFLDTSAVDDFETEHEKVTD
jgi:hypothetical protein